MVDIKLLKKIVFAANILQRFGEVDFENIKIEIDIEMTRKEALSYAFKVLEIPYEFSNNSYVFWESEGSHVIQFKFNRHFADEKYLIVLYYLTFLFTEIFEGEIKVFFDYSAYDNKVIEVLEDFDKIFAYFAHESNVRTLAEKNVMINPYDILAISITKMDWKQFIDFVKGYNHTPPTLEKDDIIEFGSTKTKESYEDYSGTYAQDYEGYSDQNINDAFDGDPDMYWNID